MDAQKAAAPTYLIGYSEFALRGQAVQARVYADITRRLLAAAGLTTGMRVLDVGCGIGEVTLLAADLVGPTGAVVGVDADPASLEVADRRARAAGLTYVRFAVGDLAGDLAGLPDETGFDAVVGRLVLLYLADPAAALRALAERLRPGGIVAFEEADIPLWQAHAAGSPRLGEIVDWIAELFRRSGAHLALGTALHGLFRAAGLGEPEVSLQVPMGGRPGWVGYEYLEMACRGLAPQLEHQAIVSGDDLRVDTVVGRLREEVIRTGRPVVLPPHGCAWARRPPG